MIILLILYLIGEYSFSIHDKHKFSQELDSQTLEIKLNFGFRIGRDNNKECMDAEPS